MALGISRDKWGWPIPGESIHIPTHPHPFPRDASPSLSIPSLLQACCSVEVSLNSLLFLITHRGDTFSRSIVGFFHGKIWARTRRKFSPIHRRFSQTLINFLHEKKSYCNPISILGCEIFNQIDEMKIIFGRTIYTTAANCYLKPQISAF